jgi:hypothetical protein
MQRFVDSGTNVFYTGPAEFRTCVMAELVKWLAHQGSGHRGPRQGPK